MLVPNVQNISQTSWLSNRTRFVIGRGFPNFLEEFQLDHCLRSPILARARRSGWKMSFFEPKLASSFAPWLADPQLRLYWSIVDWLHCRTFSVRRRFGQDFGCLQCALRVRTRFINFTMMNSMTGYSDWEKKTVTERSTSVEISMRIFVHKKCASQAWSYRHGVFWDCSRY